MMASLVTCPCQPVSPMMAAVDGRKVVRVEPDRRRPAHCRAPVPGCARRKAQRSCRAAPASRRSPSGRCWRHASRRPAGWPPRKPPPSAGSRPRSADCPCAGRRRKSRGPDRSCRRAAPAPATNSSASQCRSAVVSGSRSCLDLAIDHAEPLLDRIEPRRPRHRLQVPPRLTLLAPIARILPEAAQVFERPHRLRDRRRRVLPMGDVEIDIVGAEPLQALLDLVDDRVAPR